MIANSIPNFQTGGIETHVYELSRRLANRGHNIHLFIKSNEYRGSTMLGKINVHMIPCPPAHITIVEQIMWETKLLKKYTKKLSNADIVHAHGRYGAGIAFLKLVHKLGKPFVITLHASMFAEFRSILTELRNVETKHFLDAAQSYPFLISLQRLVLSQATKVIAVSSDNLRDLLHCYKVPVNKIEIIPNGVDTKLFSQKPVEDLKTRMGLHDKLVLLFVGNLTIRKGLHYLMKAVADVGVGSRIKLLIVGEGPYKEALKRLAVQLKIDKEVVFLGRVSTEDLVKYYSLCDVFVLPSVQEGLGIVMLEAMACGKPIIASNTGGIPDIVIHGHNGFLFQAGNVKELSSLIKKSYSGKDVLRKMGVNARALVHRKFDWEVITSKVEELYNNSVK
ncbi:MAG: glycosyltransferase family 4 protein [Candidatus Baldrarchaeia archaeon]